MIAQVDCPDNNLNTVRLGAQIPIYDSASGRVLAAFMDDAALDHLLTLAGEEPSERRAKFVADLAGVRSAGPQRRSGREPVGEPTDRVTIGI